MQTTASVPIPQSRDTRHPSVSDMNSTGKEHANERKNRAGYASNVADHEVTLADLDGRVCEARLSRIAFQLLPIA
jgi:hypothetical protein